MLFMWIHLTLDLKGHAQEYSWHWEYYCILHLKIQGNQHKISHNLTTNIACISNVTSILLYSQRHGLNMYENTNFLKSNVNCPNTISGLLRACNHQTQLRVNCKINLEATRLLESKEFAFC